MTSAPAALPPTLQFASLYVGDLHPDVGEAMLYEAFSAAGNVASCRVCKDNVTRKSLGYGYVNYYSVPDAERALDTLNYTAINGKPCRVMWSQRDPAWRKNTASNIFVKNLDESIDNKALHDTFSIFGNILSCKVSTDNNGKSKGYGFVHYEAEEAAKQAIARVNGMKIGENTVYVGPFLKRTELEASPTENFTNLYVKHLPPSWDDAKLSDVFGKYGEVASSVIMSTEEGRRFALVNYSESSAAKAAIEALHRQDVREEVDKVDEAKEPPAEEAATEEAAAEEAAAPAPAAAPAAGEEPGPDAAAAASVEEATTAVAPAAGADGEEGGTGAAEATQEEDAGAEAKEEEDHPHHLLYVQRAQSRAERHAMLEEERRKRKGAGKGKRDSGVKLCVRNLSEETTTEDLRTMFEPFGKIVHVAMREYEASSSVGRQEGRKRRGLGFVVFSSMDEATEAVSKMHLSMVDGKALNVDLAEKRRSNQGDDEPAGGGHFRGEMAGASMPRGKGGRGGQRSPKGEGKGRGGQGKGKGGKGGRGSFGPPPGALLPGMAPPYPYGMRLPMPPGAPPGAPGPYMPFPMPGGFPQMPGGPAAPGFPGMPPLQQPGAYAFPPAMAAGAPAKGGVAPGMPLGTVPGRPAMAHPPVWPMHQPLQPFPQAVPPRMMGPPALPPITREALATMPPQAQKQLLGEGLFLMNSRYRPDLAGKITGMMLELDNNEILALLESQERLKLKVDEAVRVIERAA